MNSHVFDCRDSWVPPIVREITFDWRDFVPLAKAEASKFYRKQERGRFRYEELLSVSVEALATSKGSNYAVKAINGALFDFARDDHKLVSDVEMTEEDFLRTRGPIPKAAAKSPLRVYFENGLKVTVYPAGPYRSNAQLLAGDGKVSSKHNKISVAIGRTTYNDGWSQESSGWVRAKIEADKADPKHHKQAPGSMALLLNSTEGKLPEDGVGQADYKGHGRKQRFSKSYFNAREVRRPDFDEISHVPMPDAAFRSLGGERRRRQFSFEELSSRRGNGKVKVRAVAAKRIRRVYVLDGVGHTLYTPKAYRVRDPQVTVSLVSVELPRHLCSVNINGRVYSAAPSGYWRKR